MHSALYIRTLRVCLTVANAHLIGLLHRALELLPHGYGRRLGPETVFATQSDSIAFLFHGQDPDMFQGRARLESQELDAREFQ